MGQTGADPESQVAGLNDKFGGVVSDLHNDYLEHLLVPSSEDFPGELVLPLREKLCELGGFCSSEMIFCITQKWKFNNEVVSLWDPYRAVVDFLSKTYGNDVCMADIERDLDHDCSEGVEKQSERPKKEKEPSFAVVVSYPMTEGRNALLHAMLLHEISHILGLKRHRSVVLYRSVVDDFVGKLETEVDNFISASPDDVGRSKEEQARFLERCHEIQKSWIREICADLLATYHFGPSLLCAMRHLSGVLGVFDRCSDTHPDSRLRCHFMLSSMAERKEGETEARSFGSLAALGPMFQEWLLEAEKSPPIIEMPSTHIGIVRQVVTAQRDSIIARIKELLGGKPYRFSRGLDELIERLRRGIPPDTYGILGEPASLEDILNAGWVVALTEVDRPFKNREPDNEKQVDLCHDSLNELLLKAIESSYLLTKATEKKRMPILACGSDSLPDLDIAMLTSGPLNPMELMETNKLIVTPVLARDQIREASINLRIGSHFLIPKAADLPSFDATELTEATIRGIQEFLNKSMGEEIVLHPRRLILGQTLEYICLPLNVAGMVLSRSTYGRLGLVVATATFVHPGWQGCLTLELAHYGDIPISLQCGTPVAQLVLFESGKVASSSVCRDDRPPFPTRPQFAPIVRGKDQEFLGSLKEDLGRS